MSMWARLYYHPLCICTRRDGFASQPRCSVLRNAARRIEYCYHHSYQPPQRYTLRLNCNPQGTPTRKYDRLCNYRHMNQHCTGFSTSGLRCPQMSPMVEGLYIRWYSCCYMGRPSRRSSLQGCPSTCGQSCQKSNRRGNLISIFWLYCKRMCRWTN